MKRTLLRRLWAQISVNQRRKLIALQVLTVFSSCAEAVSLGAVFPFLAAITAPDLLFSYDSIRGFFDFFGISDSSEIVLPLTLTFAIAALVAGVARLVLLVSQVRLSFSIGHDLGRDIYRKSLHQPFSVHVARNSSEVIAAISQKTGSVIANTIQPVLILTSSSLLLIFVSGALLLVNREVAISSVALFGAIYVAMSIRLRSKIKSNGEVVALKSTKVIKLLQEGLGGIRDLIIDGTQSVYVQTFANADKKLRSAQASNVVIRQSPRLVIETLGILFICAAAYFMISDTEHPAEAVAVLGTLALAAQRMLPNFQQVYAAYASLKGGQAALEDVLVLLEQRMNTEDEAQFVQPMVFGSSIVLDDVWFRYEEDQPWILKGVSLEIKFGEAIGVIGETGSGKSTLLDILMGLLTPVRGRMLVDGVEINEDNVRNWQRALAHVPQTVFLSDATLVENVAFGVEMEKVDLQKAVQAADLAQLSSMIDKLPDGLDTPMGERGVKISGGQRQRIGIARAIYRDTNVMILDEATSALDSVTEASVMENLQNLSTNLTSIVCAHRLSTLSNCDFIVRLESGSVAEYGTFAKVIGSA